MSKFKKLKVLKILLDSLHMRQYMRNVIVFTLALSVTLIYFFKLRSNVEPSEIFGFAIKQTMNLNFTQ